MAEAWLRHYHGDKIEVFSAGLEAHGINPFMKKVMELAFINIDSHTSNVMQEYEGRLFDLVITVCDHANKNCPYFKDAKKRMHKAFEDPADAKGTDDEKIIIYSKVRDQIQDFCKELIF
jgi:arsenate reductase